MTLALGIMSGTSADGASLALCRFGGKNFKVLADKNYPYPAAIQKTILRAAELKTPELSRLNFTLGHFFADCTLRFLKSARVPTKKIAVIGSHGHTVYHGPNDNPRNTLQIGEASVIAETTGIPVVSDFRPRDIAAGGEGAPLIPFFDAFFYGLQKTALQNIGGIGNVTFTDRGKVLSAFDTGPGNCLMDLVIQKHSKGRLSFDAHGQLAARGFIHVNSIKKMIAHPFFTKCPPKSTGREFFNEKFLTRSLPSMPVEDKLATLNFFTAYSIFESYRNFGPEKITKIVVSGGGSKNLTLMKNLQKLFRPLPVISIESYGIPTQAKEPAAFAFFALRAIQAKINHAPVGTGAKHPCVLGKISR